MRMLVARNVKSARMGAGLTQEELAARCGFSQQYISGLERGRRNPTVMTLFELASALNTTPSVLLSPDEI